MNDIELKALELKRKAWEVLDGKAEADVLFQELYRLERQSPDFLESVAKQLEADNGRWSVTSALPNAEVKREQATQRIEEISFHALDEPVNEPHAHEVGREQFQHVSVPKNAELEMSQHAAENAERLSVIVWRSDYGDRAWLEDFAKDINKKNKDEK
ncbi:MAG: hypothetical protein EKK48_00100 [Candidatus Melainabacteria bacterium]|nr:MAG: hypothetical protein EKK48_00100 [Candidatus Melainabacteria bacterium]